MSEYGVGPYAGWYRAQTTATALAAIALAVALGRPGQVLALLSVLAAARLLIGWFPTDTIQVGVRTTRGGIHMLLAVLAFTAASWAAVALRPDDHGLPALGWAMAACALGTALFLRNPPLRKYSGSSSAATTRQCSLGSFSSRSACSEPRALTWASVPE